VSDITASLRVFTEFQAGKPDRRGRMPTPVGGSRQRLDCGDGTEWSRRFRVARGNQESARRFEPRTQSGDSAIAVSPHSKRWRDF